MSKRLIVPTPARGASKRPGPFPGWREHFALFVALFSFYMLTTSRERPWADGTPIFEVAESIVEHGRINIGTRWPGLLPLGRDGKVYAVAPLLQSLVHVPGAAVQRLLARLAPEKHHLWRALSSHIGPSALAALAVLLFFVICRRHGISFRASVFASVALAFASTLWVYARYPYSEILQAACLLGVSGQLLLLPDRPDARNGALLGMWLGLLINAKLVMVVVVPSTLVYLGWLLRRQRRNLLVVLSAAAAAGAPLLGIILVYNHLRWGGPLTSGYFAGTGHAWKERIVVGLWGNFLSLGKSLFLYSPPLLLAAVAIARTWRRWPRLLGVIAVVAGPPLLLHSSLVFWPGDWAWGPRYAAPLVGVMLLPMALLADDVLRPRPAFLSPWPRRAKIAVTGAMLASGVFVQALGSAFHWDHHIRVSRQATEQWLGVPNRSGAQMDPAQGCGACFEDMYPMLWLPPFQPIAGHYWLAKHVLARDDWKTAEKDAPWHRYTKLPLDISDGYARARLDWWFLDFGGPHKDWGIPMLMVMASGFLISGTIFLRRGGRWTDLGD